jgi:isopenicillin-N epimerase
MFSAILPSQTDPLALKEFLYTQYHIEVPLIAWNGQILVRVSIQAYNSAQDIDMLIRALTAWLGHWDKLPK